MCPRRRWGREGEGVVAYASHVIFHRLRPSLKSVWGTNRAHLIPSFFVCVRESHLYRRTWEGDGGTRWNCLVLAGHAGILISLHIQLLTGKAIKQIKRSKNDCAI